MLLKPTLLLLLLITAITSNSNEWVHVPGGYLQHKSCIFEVPNGQLQDVDFSTCKFPAKKHSPTLQIYAMDVHYSPINGPVTQMNATWKVPNLPGTNDGQVVYFWPGFKNQQPEMGLPVLQPVLQYGQHGPVWQLQSWFVWGDEGVSVTAPAIYVQAGDSIESYMDYDKTKQVWTVYGKDTRTGQTSNLQISRSRAGNCDYQWAMLVLETIMSRNTCRDYPSSDSLTFTGVSVGGTYPKWTTRVQMHDCGQQISVTAQDTVQLTWNN